MSRYNATETDAINRDNRAASAAGVPIATELESIFDSITNAAIGITSSAADIDALALGAYFFGQDTNTTSGLTFGYKAGRFHNGSTIVSVSAGTIVLSASQTNYIEVDRAGTISTNTSGFTSGRFPLYVVITGSSAITSVTNRKCLFTLIGDGGITGTQLSTAGKTKELLIPLGDISATAAFSIIVPNVAGYTLKASFVTKTAISASDTNYWTFDLTNKGAAGSGTTKVVDGSAAANSTKATGGSAIAGYVKRDLTLNGTPGVDAALNVAAADVLELTITKAAAATTMAQCAIRLDFTFAT